jgi:hypothetical protein
LSMLARLSVLAASVVTLLSTRMLAELGTEGGAAFSDGK